MKYLGLITLLFYTASALPASASEASLPAPQQRLLNALSTYSELYNEVPSNALLPIHQSAIVKKYRNAFCSLIPHEIHNWVGQVISTRLSQSGNGIYIDVALDPYGSLSNVPLILGAGDLQVSNHLSGAGVSQNALTDHSSATIYPTSPLYRIASKISNGDIIIFSGILAPYKSQQACVTTLGETNLFGYLHFTKLTDLGAQQSN